MSAVATGLLQECQEMFKVRNMPDVTWLPEAMAPAPAGPEQPQAGTAKAAKAQMQALQPKVLTFDRFGVAVDDQDTFEPTVSHEVCKWEVTVAAVPTLELRKAALLQGLHQANAIGMHAIGGKVRITRSSNGDVVVATTKEVQQDELMFVPMVPGLSFLGELSKKTPPLSVQVPSFTAGPSPEGPRASGAADGPRASGAAGDDDGEGGGEDDVPLVILPCTRLPPKGVALEKGKNVFLHPFWVMQRASGAAEANCEMGTLQVDVLSNVSAGPTTFAGARLSNVQVLTIPVLRNTKAISADGVLIAPGAVAAAKQQKKKAAVKWDSKAASKASSKGK